VFLAHFIAFWQPLFCVSGTFNCFLATIILCFWHISILSGNHLFSASNILCPQSLEKQCVGVSL
jgi:hypothetical protein